MLQTFVIHVQIWWKECLRLNEESEKQQGAKVPFVSMAFMLLKSHRYSWKSLSILARNVGKWNLTYVSMLNNSPESIFPCWLQRTMTSLLLLVIGTVWIIWGKKQNNFSKVYLLFFYKICLKRTAADAGVLFFFNSNAISSLLVEEGIWIWGMRQPGWELRFTGLSHSSA